MSARLKNVHLSLIRGRKVKPTNTFGEVWLVSMGVASVLVPRNSSFGDTVYVRKPPIRPNRRFSLTRKVPPSSKMTL